MWIRSSEALNTLKRTLIAFLAYYKFADKIHFKYYKK